MDGPWANPPLKDGTAAVRQSSTCDTHSLLTGRCGQYARADRVRARESCAPASDAILGPKKHERMPGEQDGEMGGGGEMARLELNPAVARRAFAGTAREQAPSGVRYNRLISSSR